MNKEKVDLDDMVVEPPRVKHHKDAVLIIHFEDQGQDFTSWGVDKDGEVLSSKPWQDEMWVGTLVNLHELKLDEYPLIVSNGNFTSLNYKVIKVEEQ